MSSGEFMCLEPAGHVGNVIYAARSAAGLPGHTGQPDFIRAVHFHKLAQTNTFIVQPAALC